MPPRDPRPPFARTAPHIRGRVFQAGYRTTLGDQMWNLEVINMTTGKVLVTDNCADFATLVEVCHKAVACARAAWFYSLHQRDLRS